VDKRPQSAQKALCALFGRASYSARWIGKKTAVGRIFLAKKGLVWASPSIKHPMNAAFGVAAQR